MPLLTNLFDKYIFFGIPSSAVWDLIKATWEKVNKRKWEELYLDAFDAALKEESPRLAKYADGEVSFSREALYKVLHYDLGTSISTKSLGELTDTQFANNLAKALAEREILVISGHNLNQEDYAQLVNRLVHHAKQLFKSSVLQNQEAFQQALLSETLQNQSLLRETQSYLDEHFDLVIYRLNEHTALLHEIKSGVEALNAQSAKHPKPGEEQTPESQSSSPPIYILHLSGLHIESKSEARIWLTQLKTDLNKKLDIKQLHYLVIAGDIANQATPEDYDIAFEFVDNLAKHFKLNFEHVIVVPGNHDVNWDMSQNAYRFVYKEELKQPLPEGQYIPAGKEGVLLRNETLYQKRFSYFSEHFYNKMYGREYPLDYADQGILQLYPDDRLLFLALNSCWEVDHYKSHRERTSINIEALARALDQLTEEKYDDWLKIAVWHHPVTGQEAMKNIDFLQLLAVNGFHVCLNGHIYKSSEGFYKYDTQRGINIIGTGIFGIPESWQASNIPMQYNLLKLDLGVRSITVETRKKDDPNGAWKADARYGDSNNPQPRYTIPLSPNTFGQNVSRTNP